MFSSSSHWLLPILWMWFSEFLIKCFHGLSYLVNWSFMFCIILFSSSSFLLVSSESCWIILIINFITHLAISSINLQSTSLICFLTSVIFSSNVGVWLCYSFWVPCGLSLGELEVLGGILLPVFSWFYHFHLYCAELCRHL